MCTDKNKNKNMKSIKPKRRVYMTKKCKIKIAMRKTIIILIAIMAGAGVIGYNGQRALEDIESGQVPEIGIINRAEAKMDQKQEAKPAVRTINEAIREVTAYNAGDPNQTDSTPCDGAGGNICKMLDAGKKICAANFVPMGTLLEIEHYGICEVRDAMNARFKNRVDIAMKKSEKDRALAFGRQTLKVRVIKMAE